MRLLDRYVLRLFLSSATVFLVTLVLLSMIVDFATKAERIFAIKSTDPFVFLARYYVIRIPVYLHFILPMVTIFAASFSMVRLAKNNELLPILTSGTSLRRIAMPAVVAALLLGAADAVIEEKILPGLSDELGKGDEMLVSDRIDTRVTCMGPKGTHVEAQEYDRQNRVMKGVRLTKLSAEGRKEYFIRAARAEWREDTQSWMFYEGARRLFDERGNLLTRTDASGRQVVVEEDFPAEGFRLQSDFTPKALFQGFRFLNDFARLHELRERMEKHPNDPPPRVNYHSRFSFPLTGLVLLLLGLPAVSAVRSRSFILGTALTTLLVMAFYSVHLACLELGYKGRLSAPVAAWTAMALFGPGGLVSFVRMKT